MWTSRSIGLMQFASKKKFLILLGIFESTTLVMLNANSFFNKFYFDWNASNTAFQEDLWTLPQKGSMKLNTGRS